MSDRMPPRPTSSDEGWQAWPGQRLGLPQSGPRSIGRLGRRIAALVIDWAIAYVIGLAFFSADGLATLGVFAVMQIVLLITAGGGVGHLILRLRVVPMAGGYIGFWRPVVRTLLICIVIPAVVWDADERGLHDRLAGTVLVRV
ncbi:RDD family protein [Frigoribacterium sp. 2-23]|uniref:RDD family protein n=1 Tax=Frigoribacterium sp. 2-23 TaxID=3415006 RepID=UPI003C701053